MSIIFYLLPIWLSTVSRNEASLKADLREKQQQEEWFRSFLTQAEVFFWENFWRDPLEK